MKKPEDENPSEDHDPAYGGADGPRDFQRGVIYSASLRDCSGEGGMVSRPVLIIQNDIGNRYSQSIIVACVSSAVKTHDFPLLVEISHASIPGKSAICLNQIITVDKERLGEEIAALSAETMARVDEALRLSLGLPRNA